MTAAITRAPGPSLGRSQGAAYGGLAYAVATADDKAPNLAAQTRACFAKIEATLKTLGSDKARLLSASVYLADISEKPVFDSLWSEWIGAEPAAWPQRTCLGAQLSGGTLVEISVVAALASA